MDSYFFEIILSSSKIAFLFVTQIIMQFIIIWTQIRLFGLVNISWRRAINLVMVLKMENSKTRAITISRNTFSSEQIKISVSKNCLLLMLYLRSSNLNESPLITMYKSEDIFHLSISTQYTHKRLYINLKNFDKQQ